MALAEELRGTGVHVMAAHPGAIATGFFDGTSAVIGPSADTPETVAAALMDYYDLGVRILSARGYDLIGDAREFGREVIPLVRAEVARRDAAA